VNLPLLSRRALPVLLSLTLFVARAQAQDEGESKTASPAQKFILDYDVPESPALIAIGAAPANVIRGSAAKPVVAHLVNQFTANEKIDNGIALDFSPYFVFGGRLKSIDEYRKSAFKRIMANTQFSVGTAQSTTDSTALLFGLGIRATLFDSHDLLKDKQLGQEIDAALAAAASAVGADTLEDDVVTHAVDRADLTQAYDNAQARVRNRKGDALTFGWGMGGLLKGSIASGDSVAQVRHRLWLSYRHSFGGGMEVLGIAQWFENDSVGSSFRAGTALRTNGPNYNFAAEVFFDSNPDEVASGRFGIGANGEVRFTRGLGLVAAIATEPVQDGNNIASKLRVRTSIRWNMSSAP
jgi:hypothetical protein